MNRLNQQQELEAIVTALTRFSNGATSDEIQQSAGLALIPRTMQRRLEKLESSGKIRSSGQTSGRLYYPVKTYAAESTVTIVSEPQPPAKPQLSPAALDIQRKVTLPFARRKPVGYNRDFLKNYQPNKTFYLTAKEREYLKEKGQTPTLSQPAGTFARQILNRLLIDLAWNSSRLEGNTYSLLDTDRLLKGGTPATEKSAAETQMILNHKDAIEFLVENADDTIGFNRYTITSLHALLSNNLLADPGAPGRLRTFGVGITGSAYTPEATPQLIEEAFTLLLKKAAAIKDPFEQAFFAMVQLPYLQPFDDVNKRVSRLAANIPLNRHNLAPLSFTAVPQDLYVSGLLGVYELNRVDLLKELFIWAYERSAVRYAALRQTIGEPDPFRLQYRELLQQLIHRIILGKHNANAASLLIGEEAQQLTVVHRQRFAEMAETELLSLHEGNFARYRVTPGQYKAWRDAWDR